jgi:hypothetical protein
MDVFQRLKLDMDRFDFDANRRRKLAEAGVRVAAGAPQGVRETKAAKSLRDVVARYEEIMKEYREDRMVDSAARNGRAMAVRAELRRLRKNERAGRWRKAHRKEANEASQLWKWNHPEYARAYYRRRKAERLSSSRKTRFVLKRGG